MPYFMDGDAYLLIASNGGRAYHPNWYFNLRAKPETTIQVGARRRGVKVVVLEEDAYEIARQLIVSRQPRYLDYLSMTDRKIPIVKLVP